MVHGWAGFIIVWQSTEAFGRISFPGLLALFALEIWCIIPFDLVSGSYLFYVWVLFVEYCHWILREMTWSMSAMFGSTVDMGTATVLGFWTNFTQSLRCGRLESCSVALPSVAERRSVPSRCFWLQFRSAQFAPGNLEFLSRVPRGWW